MKPRSCAPIVRVQNESIYNMSHSKQIPELPPLPESSVVEPSELYQLIQKSSHFPSLMQRASWTLAAPFKEQPYFRSPSDSIANNYTLTARDLKLKDLQKMMAAAAKAKKAKQRAESPPPKEYAPSEKKLKLSPRSTGEPDRAAMVPQVSILEVDVLQTPPRSELEVIHYSDIQPLTPEQQFVVMYQHEEEINKYELPPTSADLERYCYYIHRGIRKDMLAPQDKEVMESILKHLSSHFLINPNLEDLLKSLTQEIQNDYHIWLMKDIVDYILKDPEERKRLFIHSLPRPFPKRVIRAPVPWHQIYQEARAWNESHLFTVNPMMLTLQEIWFSEFSGLRFVRTKDILAGDLPLLPGEFEDLIHRHCLEARDILQNRWIPTCAELFIDQKEKWLHFAPQSDLDSSQPIEEYFASVAMLMSLQLREMVINSLEDLLSFFKIHENGNDFGEIYHEMQFFIPQILVLKLDVEDPTIIFEPHMKDCWDLIYRCFMEILKNSEGLPKVQVKLFPELKGEDLVLRTVQADESLVSDYVVRTAEIFDRNIVGPQK